MYTHFHPQTNLSLTYLPTLLFKKEKTTLVIQAVHIFHLNIAPKGIYGLRDSLVPAAPINPVVRFGENSLIGAAGNHVDHACASIGVDLAAGGVSVVGGHIRSGGVVFLERGGDARRWAWLAGDWR